NIRSIRRTDISPHFLGGGKTRHSTGTRDCGHSTGMTRDCGHSTGDDQRLRT
ncbi:unnamed protein product, partial [Staurois parvus]